jgi:hypothetical protein
MSEFIKRRASICLLGIVLLSGCATPPRRSVISHAPTDSRPLSYENSIKATISGYYYMLMSTSFPHHTTFPEGKVVLKFRLYPDGHVSDVNVVESTMDDSMVAICKRAILDTAPFEPWPESMRRRVHWDYVSIPYVFYFGKQPVEKPALPSGHSPKQLVRKL